MTVPRSPGRPPFLDDARIVRISLPGELRAWLRAERERTGDSESEIVRRVLLAERTRRDA